MENNTMNADNRLEGKKGIVFGLANDRSYAWYISQALFAAGAEVIFGYYPTEKNELRFRNALKELGRESAEAYPCDVTREKTEITDCADRLPEKVKELAALWQARFGPAQQAH